MRNIFDITAAELKYSTRLVFGEAGSWCRVSRCLSTPMVRLYESKSQCDEAERAGRPCCKDCRGTQHHATEFVEPLCDEVPEELGYEK